MHLTVRFYSTLSYCYKQHWILNLDLVLYIPNFASWACFFFVQFKQPYVILSGRCPHVDYPTLTDFDRSPNSWVKLQSQTSKGWTVRLFWVKDVTCFNNSSSIIICWPKSKYFENISAVFVSIVYIGYCNGSSFYHVESLGYFCWSIWAW